MSDLEAGFREHIKAERRRCGLSQEQVAKKSGLHRVTYTKIENGTSEKLLLSTATTILNALGSSWNDVLREANRKEMLEYSHD